MTKMIGGVAVKPASEIEFDTSLEHPALTPLVRRLAGEYWTIVQRRAEEAGLLLRSARLVVDHDVEDATWVVLKVRAGASFEETMAFWRSLGPDVERWVAQMDPKSREAKRWLMLDMPWLAASSFAAGNGV